MAEKDLVSVVDSSRWCQLFLLYYLNFIKTKSNIIRTIGQYAFEFDLSQWNKIEKSKRN